MKDLYRRGTAEYKQAKTLEARVWETLQKGDSRQAVAICQGLNRSHPEFTSGWNTASQLAMKLNNPKAALQAIEKALAIEPQHSPWILQKALCVSMLGRKEQLGPLVQLLLNREMRTAYEYSALAMLATSLELREEAIALYRKAADLKPGQSQHFYNIAILQRSLGDIEAAERNLDHAIGLNPADYEAWKVRSELRTWTADNNHVKALKKLLSRGIEDSRGKVNICYALARELEDLEEWADSFHYLKLGADTRRGYMKYDIRGDLEVMTRIRSTFKTELFDGQMEGFSSAEPIFILGLPRTGTTLVERILASHSEVFSAGELNNFTFELMNLVRAGGLKTRPSRLELIELTTRLDFKKLGQSYVASTRPATGHTLHFIDKMPLNFLYAGLIHLAMPNAKIINLQRNPMDTCYAIYKQLFMDAYPFSYDLKEIGRYFIAYSHLMAHWNKLLPGVIYTVRYEDLVDDVEAGTRGLLEFCGLDWQEQCLRFYESKEASTTASTVQVRQPVYRSSVGKWKHYEAQLRPLADLLETAGIVLES